MIASTERTDPMEARILEGEITGPEYLGPGGPTRGPRPIPGIDTPKFLYDDWDEELPIITPKLLLVEGGAPLLYEGESHSLSGPGGAGKSFFTAFAIAQTVATSHAVCVYVDYEGNRRSFRQRLKALGVSKEQTKRIAYWSVSYSLMPNSPGGQVWIDWVDLHRPDFVVLDSVSKACDAAGLNDRQGNEYQRWDSGVIVPLTHRGITSLRIDHTGHETGFGTGGHRERGASEKGQAVSGASYLFEVGSPWAQDSDGWGTLKVLKDRHGARKSGSVAARLDVKVENLGANVTMKLSVPRSLPTNVDGSLRLTGLMEKVSRIAEASPEALSMRQIRDLAGGNHRAVGETVSLLHREGYLTMTAGPRSSKLLSSARPYRQSEDPLSDKYVGESPF